MFWLILAVLIWGMVHSLMASLGIKASLQRVFGNSVVRFYRLAYNAFSVISFMPVLWLMTVLPDQSLYHIPAPWIYCSLTGQAFAALLLVIGVLQTDTLSFIGLRQLIEGKERPSKLVTRGLYQWVRHPLYTAGLLFIWLTPVMSKNTLFVCGALTIYIIAGIYFEERRLEREFGTAYEEYKASTPMLIPGFVLQRNK